MSDLCDRYEGDEAVVCVYGCMAMQARSLEGAAAPEARASPQQILSKESWCREQFGVRASDHFDRDNLNHMKVRERPYHMYPQPSPWPLP